MRDQTRLLPTSLYHHHLDLRGGFPSSFDLSRSTRKNFHPPTHTTFCTLLPFHHNYHYMNWQSRNNEGFFLGSSANTSIVPTL